VHGQPTSAKQDLQDGERAYQRGDLAQAEKHFRAVLSALPEADRALRDQCYDRLLAIYPRFGQYDRAIKIGRDYAARLKKEGEERRWRMVEHRLGACYLALGHYDEARKRFKQVEPDQPDTPPTIRIEAHAYLAQVAEKLARSEEAAEHWLKVLDGARTALLDRNAALTDKEAATCTWKLAESCRYLKYPKVAIDWLAQLAEIQERAKQHVGLCETLRLRAGHEVADGQLLAAKLDMRRAIDTYDLIADRDPVRAGDLRAEMAALLEQYQQPDDAAQWRERAAMEYERVLRADRPRPPEHQSTEAAFWALRRLYQQAELYKKALDLALTDEQTPLGPNTRKALTQSRLEAEQGVLSIYLGAYPRALPALRAASTLLEEQSVENLVENLVDYPRVLTSLAIVELNSVAGGNRDADNTELPERRAKKVQELYKKYYLPNDLVLVETWNILGTCNLWRGDYREAIKDFRAGAALCELLGGAAQAQRCNLLLNIAILHRSQHELQEAIAVCKEARAVYLESRGKDTKQHLGDACFLCGMVGMHAAAGEFKKVDAHANALLVLCEKYNVRQGPLKRTALHGLALAHLARKDYAAAHKLWDEVRKMQEQSSDFVRDEAPRDALLPNTLNWLGLTAELQGQPGAAEEWYAKALRLQPTGVRAYPTALYTTLCRLAGLCESRGDRKRARELLEQAIGVVEGVRLNAWGGPQQRAAYLAQFDAAFDRLVEVCVRNGDTADALMFSARSRSRSLFDQLQVADEEHGVDLAPEHKHLRDQEESLRKTISRIRVGAQMLVSDSDSIDIDRLLSDLDDAQKRYASVQREIYNVSKAYQGLAPDAKLTDLLPNLQKHVVRPGRVLLTYHIGAERSYVMLVSDGSPRPEVWPLTVPARLLDAVRAAQPATGSTSAAALNPMDAPIASPVTAANGSPAWLLNRPSLRLLVGHHLRQLDDPQFTTRGLRLSWDSAVATPGEILEQIADTVLPRAVRVRLTQLSARQVVVVPDGALHRLPLESLVLRAGTTPRYVLDELPPMVYAPSLSVLAHLAQRPSRPASGSPSLLTVCNPAYPINLEIFGAGAVGLLASPQSDRSWMATAALMRSRDFRTLDRPHDGRILLRGDLRLLPYTAEESRQIRGRFEPAQVLALEGSAATEKALRKHIEGRHIVHLAVHGMAGQKSVNTCGDLFLARPADGKVDPDDDGLLSLWEIYRLPLDACDLAVLSACETSVGPQLPLEAGESIANAFLTAGARQVISSHWHVEDRSTAELMSQFFEQAMAAGGQGVPYAQALQNARKKLRNTPQWSAPIYWAPFVLFSAGDATGTESPSAEHQDPAVAEVSPETEWYESPWFVPAVAIAVVVALVVLVWLVMTARRKTNDYRMPGT
jgi:CHAT domain-containing protein/tetratricopeptide (TPR) repeat protein